MLADQPPTAVVTGAPHPAVVEQLRQTPILYDADTGQPIGGRLQRWARAFTLPTGASVKVRIGPNPGLQEPASYVRGGTTEDDVLYFDPSYYRGGDKELTRDARWALWHELGHRYDRRYADQAVRDRFSQIMGMPGDWEAGGNAPKEQFADAVAAYTRGFRRGGRVPQLFVDGRGEPARPTRRQWRQIRRLFDSV